MSSSEGATTRAAVANIERADVRVLVAFAIVAAVLLAPAIPRSLAPLSTTAAADAAATFDAEAREGIALAEDRSRATGTYVATELADLAASAADTRLDLLHSEASPDAAETRRTLIDLGAQLRDELELLSVSVDDPAVLASGADRLAAISAQLQSITG